MSYLTFETSLSCWFVPYVERLTRSVKADSRYILKEIRETTEDEKQGLDPGG